MKRFNFLSWAMVVLLVVVLAPTTMAAGLPDLGEGDLSVLDNGREYIRWNMKVEYERVHLTLSTPCGVIERTYEAGENPVFELAELEPDDPTGSYNWQLRIEPYIDPDVRETLNKARAKDDYETVRALRRKGLLPEGPFVQSGFFTVDREGGIVDFTQVEKEGLRVDLNDDGAGEPGRNLGVVTGESIGLVTEKQVISGDLTVYNSLCVGFDCPTNPTFGADTIRMQENNLRIHADDTSTASSFPNQDWRLEFNSNLNGGGEYFRVIDATANRNIMTIEANAPSNSLYVESSGELGIGTANPVLEVHAVDGDTPGLRLEQDTSSGFGAQVWDLAGNETNFFLRDATNGSTLPFRVFPGSPSSTLVVRDGNVGIGTSSPNFNIDIDQGTSNPANFVVRGTSGSMILQDLDATTGEQAAQNLVSGGSWRLRGLTDDLSGQTVRGITVDLGDGDVGILCDSSLNSDLTIGSQGSCSSGTRSELNAGDTTFTASSSRTIKENIRPAQVENILERIRSVGVFQYDFIDGPQNKLGLMAEEFHQVFQRGSDKLLNGQEVQMALWMAVQELTTHNEALQERIGDLESRLDDNEASPSVGD